MSSRQILETQVHLQTPNLEDKILELQTRNLDDKFWKPDVVKANFGKLGAAADSESRGQLLETGCRSQTLFLSSLGTTPPHISPQLSPSSHHQPPHTISPTQLLPLPRPVSRSRVLRLDPLSLLRTRSLTIWRETVQVLHVRHLVRHLGRGLVRLGRRPILVERAQVRVPAVPDAADATAR